MKTLSTTETKLLFNSSYTYVYDLVQKGKLQASWESQGKRKVLRISEHSALSWVSNGYISKSVGREMPSLEFKSRKPTLNRGYIYVYTPDHPAANCNGYVAEHRLIMEKELGRYLERKEDVHHINGIRTDNRPENLILFGSRGEHIKSHTEAAILMKLRRACQLKPELIPLLEKTLEDFLAHNPAS